jgi:hypothetical protein
MKPLHFLICLFSGHIFSGSGNYKVCQRCEQVKRFAWPTGVKGIDVS